MKSHIKLGNRLVGKDQPPFVIAEMSGNHNQSLDRALSIVRSAAASGVDALKIQTYTADTMTLNIREGDFVVNDKNSLWYGRTLYELYQEAATPWEWHKPIFDLCAELGIVCFSTPFDETSIDFLESLNAPFYKIASFENTDLPLIRKVAQTGKPLIISTGMATAAELDELVRTVRKEGCEDFILLKCTSTYPATPENTNLATIPHMEGLFDCQVGLSDHTAGIGAAVAAVVFGATVIEKHFTLDRKDGGVDSVFSLEPHELKALVIESKRAWAAKGVVHYGTTEQEKKSLLFKRSLYIVESIKAGERLNEKNLRAIRPGAGLPTKFLDIFLGKTVRRDVKAGTPLNWDLI